MYMCTCRCIRISPYKLTSKSIVATAYMHVHVHVYESTGQDPSIVHV